MPIWHDMFQWKIDEIYKELPNVFCIADKIFIAGYDTDGRDNNIMLKQVT